MALVACGPSGGVEGQFVVTGLSTENQLVCERASQRDVTGPRDIINFAVEAYEPGALAAKEARDWNAFFDAHVVTHTIECNAKLIDRESGLLVQPFELELPAGDYDLELRRTKGEFGTGAYSSGLAEEMALVHVGDGFTDLGEVDVVVD